MENKIFFILLLFSVFYVSSGMSIEYFRSKTFNIFQPPLSPITTSLFDNFTDVMFTLYGDDMKNNPPILLGTLLPQSGTDNPLFQNLYQNSQYIKMLAHFNCPCEKESCIKFNFTKSVKDLCLMVASVDGYDRVSISTSNLGEANVMSNWTIILNGSISNRLPPAVTPEIRHDKNQIQLGCFEEPMENINYELFQPDNPFDQMKLCYKSYDVRSQYVYYSFIQCAENKGTQSPYGEEFALSGFAFVDRMHNSQFSAENIPLEGVKVTLLSNGVQTYDKDGYLMQPVYTNKKGYYFFQNIYRNIYTVKFEYSNPDFVSFSTIQSTNQSQPLTNKVNQQGITIPLRVTTAALGNLQLDELEKTYITKGKSGILRDINAGFIFETDGMISGTVFIDYNANGIMDTTPGLQAIDIPKPNIQVLLLLSSDNTTLVSSRFTDENGYFSFTNLSYSSKYTVDVNLTLDWVKTKPPPAPPANKVSVSYYTSIYPSGNVNVGIVNYAGSCQDNPPIALTCFTKGSYNGPNANDSVVISFPLHSKPNLYNDTSNKVIHWATHGQIGAVYGLGFHRKSQSLFVSAFTKYFTSYGPSGTGAIYRIIMKSEVVDTPFITTFFDLNKKAGENYAGEDLHPANITNYDETIDQVGKASFGDLDIDDYQFYTIALQTKELLTVSISDPNKYNLTQTFNPCENQSDWRPFAIGINSLGELHIGGVCSMESSDLETPPVAYILKGNETVISLQLDYPMGCKMFGNGLCTPGRWVRWSPVYYDPQPIISDITFEPDDSSLIMSIRDRGGDMNLDVGIYDMVKACKNPNTGKYEWEYLGSCGGKVGAHPRPSGYLGMPDGIGGGEFFDDNFFYPPDNTGHDNLAATSSFFIPGYRYLFGTSLDIDRVGQGAFKWWDKDNGTFAGGLGVYLLEMNKNSLFGKSNGLGDTAALCDYVGVGNYRKKYTNNLKKI
ncbi:colossin D [Heterostelium album PN500]|uniref:Colossin D n=1 Tax=Heterostelium pallidum (strain ATCC 26659 / Pp 5 / PN500) TaxID=670386 RepID=D3BN53_HETP5|nr:colossin D [Heterostelium album PN500]EFA77415.1 colossin D [Heterostelium album PN500]|eukprot:XP_020429544.1 colossin D [Heterostelium album PN500]